MWRDVYTESASHVGDAETQIRSSDDHQTAFTRSRIPSTALRNLYS